MTKPSFFFFLLLLVASFFEAEATNTCSWGNFYCSYSRVCKSSQWRCDGGRDCTNGEDEAGCRTACPNRRSQFRCNNLRCITRSHLCDGDNDCGDNSDESNFVCGGRRTTYPKCHTCASTLSYEDCEKKSQLTACTSTTASCYKMDYKVTRGSGEVSLYAKGCFSIPCSTLRSAKCSNYLKDCNVYCCTGSGCNAGSIQRLSVVALVTCAVAFLVLGYPEGNPSYSAGILG